MSEASQPSSWRQRLLRRRVLIPAAVGAVVLAGLGVMLAGRGDSADSATDRSGAPIWYTVEKRSFDQTVSASGELTAEDQIEIKSQVEGSTQIVELVDEGTTVKGPVKDAAGKVVEPGQVIARLADDRIKDRIEQTTLDVERARADKVAAEQALAIAKKEAETNLQSAEIKVQQAQLDLQKWRNGDDLQKQRELQLALEKAQRTLTRANEDVALSQQLYAESFIAKAELDDDLLKQLEARSGLATAELNVEVYQKYQQPKDAQNFQIALDQNKAELERLKAKTQMDLARLQADLESKTRSLKIREETLEKANRQWEATVIRAPRDGLVIYATSVGGGRRRDPMVQGKSIGFNESLFLMPDTRRLNATIKVHEAMIAQVKPEQKVAVTIDAIPGRTFDGKVVSIGVTPEDGGWMNPDLREYKVVVDLPDNVNALLKPAMRCQGRIIIGRVEDALAVPIQAVMAEGRRMYCYVEAGGGKVRRTPVKIGRSSETMAEIASGLTEGQNVLLRKPNPAEIIKADAEEKNGEKAGEKNGTKNGTKKNGGNGSVSIQETK